MCCATTWGCPRSRACDLALCTTTAWRSSLYMSPASRSSSRGRVGCSSRPRVCSGPKFCCLLSSGRLDGVSRRRCPSDQSGDGYPSSEQVSEPNLVGACVRMYTWRRWRRSCSDSVPTLRPLPRLAPPPRHRADQGTTMTPRLGNRNYYVVCLDFTRMTTDDLLLALLVLVVPAPLLGHADRLRRHLDELLLGDVLDRRIQGQLERRT